MMNLCNVSRITENVIFQLRHIIAFMFKINHVTKLKKKAWAWSLLAVWLLFTLVHIQLEFSLFSITQIDESDAREALLNFVAEKCCYGKAAANELQIMKISPSCALHVSQLLVSWLSTKCLRLTSTKLCTIYICDPITKNLYFQHITHKVNL